MFGDINRATILGNVTKDPELRFTPSGNAVLSFSVATNRRFQKNNEWIDSPSFHNIVVWNNAEELAKRIKKGTRLYLEGRIETRSWESQDGKKNYKTEINVEKVILIDRYEGKADQQNAEILDDGLPNNSMEEDIDPSDLPF